MKRNLLAIAIPALLIAGSANASIEIWNKDSNKVNLNGRIYALNYLTDRENQGGEGDKTTARIGITGETQISENLTGYGRWEWQTNTGKNSFDEARYAFAGFNFGDLGSFDYGRNDGVLKTVTSYSDVLPEFGGDASNNDWYALTNRTKAVATYRNNNLFGLTDSVRFALQYADNGDNSSTKYVNQSSESSEAWGSAFEWDILDSGVSFGAGYAQTGGQQDVKTLTTAVKYNYDFDNGDNFYLGALFIESKLKNGWNVNRNEDLKIQGLEFVAQYGMEFDIGRLTPSIGYIQHKVKDADTLSGDAGLKSNYLVKYVDVGVSYAFNKNLTGLIDYKINLLDKDDIGARHNLFTSDSFTSSQISATTKDTVAIGLIYQF